LKIALLTPYTGSNLGDAAIQDAVIDNIRMRYPEASICMISINPAATTKLHHVLSFPITPFGISHYAPNSSTPEISNKIQRSQPAINIIGVLDSAKKIIIRAPLLYKIIKGAKRIITCIFDSPKSGYQEIAHALKSYNLLKDIDLLIVSGGGQLDDYWGGPWGHPYALLKWGIIAKIRGAQYIFLSVGTCALTSKLSIIFVKQALKIANYRSYRDNTSKKLLDNINFTHKDLVYPDLAFSYVIRANSKLQNSAGNRKTVGISPITFLPECGWFKNDITAYKKYLDTLAEFTSTLIRNGYSILFFSTDIPDRKAVNYIVETIRSDHKLDVTNRIREALTDSPETLFDQLYNVDYVVASRLHGILLSNLYCLPVLAISYDRKVDTYMADAGFKYYTLTISNIDIDLLLNKFESLVTNTESVKSKLNNNIHNNASELKRQYNFVLRSEGDA